MHSILLRNSLSNSTADWLSDDQPIAVNAGSWTPAVDAESQDDWDVAVGSALNTEQIIQAGNSNSAPPAWGAAELIATQNSTAKLYVLDYAHHNYPGGTISSLMSHSGISSNINIFSADIAAAVGAGKDYVLERQIPVRLILLLSGSSISLT